MASYSDITTLVTAGGTITFNAATGNTYLVDPLASTGLDAVKLRKPVDHKGQTDGYIRHQGFEEGDRILLSGVIVADTTANRDAMIGSLKTALASIKSSDGTLNFGTSTALSVQWDVGVDFPRLSANVVRFVFGLVTET